MSGSDDITKALERAIHEARNLPDKPPNEACTCDWVIRPLLEAAGYAKHEIVSQGTTPGGGYPDYTILPETQWTWYLEAKEWKKSLENGADAVQALNYANARGHRWVVLSNGRQWLLFDNHLMGLEAPQRLVARADLTDEGFLDFMWALSKPSITADKLGHWVTRSRAKSVLGEQLRDRNSEVVKAITSALRKLGIRGASTIDVVEYFGGPAVIPPPPPPPPPVLPEGAYSLSELLCARDRLAYTVPSEIAFPDGSAADVPYWADVAHRVVQWLADRGKLAELPFRGLPGGERSFLARQPVHPNGKEMDPRRKVQLEQGTVFMDANRSTRNFVRCLNALCESVGEPASGFTIKLSPPSSPARCFFAGPRFVI